VISQEVLPSKLLHARKLNVWNRVSRVIIVLEFAATLGGCEPVQSLSPFCNPKDVIHDPDLDGTWVSKKEDGFFMKLRFEETLGKTDDYRVEAAFHDDDPGRDKPREGLITFSVSLFQVGDSRFADFYPLTYSAKWGPRTVEFEASDNLFGVPAHTVYRVKLDKTNLQLAWLDDDRVENFLAKNKLPLAVPGTTHCILSGEPEELKSKLLLNAEREELLNGDIELTRQP